MGVDEATNEQTIEKGVQQRTKSAISLVDLATSQTAETNVKYLYYLMSKIIVFLGRIAEEN
jgi:hypothetical protein